MDNKKIGAFIAELRKEKGLNQSELANLLGVTNKAVSKWECGDGYPEITLVPSIAKVLGITVDELLDGERIITSPNLKTTYSDSLMISSMNKFKKYFYISLGLAAFSILDLVVSRAINYNQSEIFAFISFLIFALCLMTSIIIYAIHYNDIKTRIVKYKDSFKKDEYYDMVKSILKVQNTIIWTWIFSLGLFLSQLVMIMFIKLFSILIFNVIVVAFILAIVAVVSLLLNRYKLKQIDFYSIDKNNLHQKYKKWLLNGVNIIASLSGIGILLCGIFIEYIYRLRFLRSLYNPYTVIFAAIICIGVPIACIILNVTRYKLK